MINKNSEEIPPEHFDREVDLLFVTEEERIARAEMDRRVRAGEVSTQEYDDFEQELQMKRDASRRELRHDQRRSSWLGRKIFGG